MPDATTDITPAPEFVVDAEVDVSSTLLTVTMNGPTPNDYISVTVGLERDPDQVDVEHATDLAATAIVKIRDDLRGQQ